MIYPWNMVVFHKELLVYQRVRHCFSDQPDQIRLWRASWCKLTWTQLLVHSETSASTSEVSSLQDSNLANANRQKNSEVILVGGAITILKNMKVNGKDDNPYITHRIHVCMVYMLTFGVLMVNVTIYTIHGSYGLWTIKEFETTSQYNYKSTFFSHLHWWLPPGMQMPHLGFRWITRPLF